MGSCNYSLTIYLTSQQHCQIVPFSSNYCNAKFYNYTFNNCLMSPQLCQFFDYSPNLLLLKCGQVLRLFHKISSEMAKMMSKKVK